MQQLDVTDQLSVSVEKSTICKSQESASFAGDASLLSPSYLSLYYNNIRGMSSKKDDILLSTTASDYDVFVFSETWLNDGKFDAEFFDPRFSVYRKDRSKSSIEASKGGGVLISIDSKYDSELINFPEMDPLEAIFVKINLRSSNSCLYIYGLYIQYDSSEGVYTSHLNALVKSHSMISHGDIFVAVGDFNMPTVKWLKNDEGFDYLPLIGDSESIPAKIARTMTTTLLDCGLFQMTDFTNHCNNVLDLVYTNMPELFVVTTADLPIIPDTSQDVAHVPMHCMIECEPSLNSTTPSTESIYCFKKADFTSIRTDLTNTDFDVLFANKDLDGMLQALYNRCYEIFDQHIPKASLRFTNHPV